MIRQAHQDPHNPCIIQFPGQVSLFKMKFSSSVLALLLASSVIAVPFDPSADAGKLAPRAAPVCTADGRIIDPSCWDALKIGDYLTSWGKSTPNCADISGSGSNCCSSRESWSTCFLRLASGTAGYQCDDMSPTFCTNAPQLSEKIGPDIRPQVMYVIHAIFSVHQLFASYNKGK